MAFVRVFAFVSAHYINETILKRRRRRDRTMAWYIIIYIYVGNPHGLARFAVKPEDWTSRLYIASTLYSCNILAILLFLFSVSDFVRSQER